MLGFTGYYIGWNVYQDSIYLLCLMPDIKQQFINAEGKNTSYLSRDFIADTDLYRKVAISNHETNTTSTFIPPNHGVYSRITSHHV